MILRPIGAVPLVIDRIHSMTWLRAIRARYGVTIRAQKWVPMSRIGSGTARPVNP